MLINKRVQPFEICIDLHLAAKTKNTNHLRLVFFEFGLDVGGQIMHQRKIKLSRKNAWCYFMIELRIGGFPILACLDDETSAFEDPPKDTTD
jgi:hypothetical protein